MAVALFNVPAFGQVTNTLFHYVIGEEELANSDIYTIYFDEEEELIFLGTNAGLYVYSQSSFHKLKVPEKVVGNSFFDLKENQEGDLFCKNLNGQIFKVFQDSLQLYYTMPEPYLSEEFGFLFDRNNFLICYGNNLVRVNNPETEEIDVFECGLVNSVIDEEEQGYIVGYNFVDLNKRNFDPIKEVTYYPIATSKPLVDLTPHRVITHQTATNLSGMLVETRNRAGEVVERFAAENIQSIVPLNDTLMGLHGVSNGLTLLTYKDDQLSPSKQYFSDRFISTMHLSPSGILFLGTFKNGLIIVPNSDLEGVSFNDLGVNIFINESDKGDVLLQMKSGKVSVYDPNSVIPGFKQEFSISSHKIYMTQYSGDEKEVLPHALKMGSWFRDGADLGGGLIGAVGHSGTRLINDPDGIMDTLPGLAFQSQDLLKNKRLFNITADSVLRRVYVSGSKGLYVGDYDNLNYKELKYNGESLDPSDLVFYNNRLFCGTFTHGVQIFENEVGVKSINTENGLLNNQVLHVKPLDQQLYIHTLSGMQIYDLETDQFLDNMQEFNLLGSSVIKFDVTEDRIALLQKNAFYTINRNTLHPQTEISHLYLDSVLSNAEAIDTNLHMFDYLQNSFFFYVDYRDPRTKFRTKIEYKLEGLFDEWNVLSPNEHLIEFRSLSPGDYTLKIRARLQELSSETIVYQFTILPPFWQRWWFYTAIFFFSVGLVSWIFYSRLKRERLQAKQRLEVERSNRIATNAQLKAIRAQMNPHFIFNAINSIQHLVLENEKLKSYDYLESFSRLVRLTLDYSEREFIRMDEEVDFLELYLELESLRFNNELYYEINTEDTIRSRTIPSLVVQPFVENAIKHGLLHKKGIKKLRINFTRHNARVIECVIVDEGVGRERVKEIMARRGSTHASFSTNAIKNRMDMLGEQLGIESTYTIEDLYNEKDEPIGTKVIILLPIIEQWEQQNQTGNNEHG